MKPRRLVSAFLCVTAPLIFAAAHAAPPITSTFSGGSEGWTIIDLSCANYAQIVGGGTVTWFKGGGAPGGFIRATDPSGNCYAFESPANFEGDRSDRVGGLLRWKIRTNVADWLPGSVLILIGGGQVLVADVPQPTAGTWLDYEVPLVSTAFRIGNASGSVATPAQFAAAMETLTSIRISAEFGSEQGEETVDLDSVVLISGCPADLNSDGVVDSADLGALLSAWGPSGSSADLNVDGIVDSADLGTMLSAWGPCQN